MKRDPSDEACPICGADGGAFMASLLTHFVWSYEARGSFPCGTTFSDARAFVNAGDAERLALDAGDA